MNCPYCSEKMIQGKLCAIGNCGPAIRWKDELNEIRLNDEPKIIAGINGDRITAHRCARCKKIIVEYNN